jgi:hypothetical protein
MQEMKTFVAETLTTKVEELKSVVLGQQKYIDNIQGSLKLLEVVMCTKSGHDNPVEAVGEPAAAVANVVAAANSNAEEHRTNVSHGKRKFVDNDNEYETEADKEKELANIDLTFTDDDDDVDVHAVVNKTVAQTVTQYNLMNKHNSPKPPLPDAWTNTATLKNTTDLSNRAVCGTSSFRRVSNPMDVDADGLNQISKKLFHSPCTTPKTATPGKKGGTSSRGKKSMTTSVTKKSRMVLPRGIKWNFPVTADMQLDAYELQALAYVYHPDKDKQ